MCGIITVKEHLVVASVQTRVFYKAMVTPIPLN
jgi:hypothetical protein